MCKIINFLDIVNILFALVLSVVINLERSLRSHEVWISLRVVVGRNLLPVESQTYYRSDIILSAMHAILYELVQTFVLSIKVISRLIEPVHVFLAL